MPGSGLWANWPAIRDDCNAITSVSGSPAYVMLISTSPSLKTQNHGWIFNNTIIQAVIILILTKNVFLFAQ